MTNGEFVSQIIIGLRYDKKDTYIPKKHILTRGYTKANYYLTKLADSYAIYDKTSLFTTINCFPLKPDNVVSCDVITFRRCGSVMKTINKLPPGIEGRNGAIISSVTTLDGKEITRWSDSGQGGRKFANSGSPYKYYENDGHIYLPDSNLEAINVTYLTLNSAEAENLSGCGDCSCKSIWEAEFKAPKDIIEIVTQELIQELAGTHKQITPDENANLTENQKDKSII